MKNISVAETTRQRALPAIGSFIMSITEQCRNAFFLNRPMRLQGTGVNAQDAQDILGTELEDLKQTNGVTNVRPVSHCLVILAAKHAACFTIPQAACHNVLYICLRLFIYVI